MLQRAQGKAYCCDIEAHRVVQLGIEIEPSGRGPRYRAIWDKWRTWAEITSMLLHLTCRIDMSCLRAKEGQMSVFLHEDCNESGVGHK